MRLIRTLLVCGIVAAFIPGSPSLAEDYTASSPESAPVVGRCHVEMKQKERAAKCNATNVGGLCSGTDYKDIYFQQAFSAPPIVLVTPAHVSDESGCVGSATDKFRCFPSAITKTGFRLYCSGSPQGPSCPGYESWSTYASANWIAIDSDPVCGAVSQHDIKPTTCEGTFTGGLCKGWYTTHITFASAGKTFQFPPHVLTAAEKTSDQGGCVQNFSDIIRCYPRDIDVNGFDLVCSGSPSGYDCGAYSSWASYASGGWLARADERETGCHVESAHDIVTDECPGTLGTSGVCSVQFRKDIVFSKPFHATPLVLVSPEHVSAGPTCAGGATDTVSCFAQNVTTTGATLICAGSPVGPECGNNIYEAWYTKARVGYIAMEPGC